MLCWPCDLIIAADDARFGDPVIAWGSALASSTTAHTWEFGPRKAKELLFTAGFMGAEEAHQRGMVNRVVPLTSSTSAPWRWRARSPRWIPFALRMAKRAVNTTLDIQGFHNSLQAVFDTHWVGHAHAWAIAGHNNTVIGVQGMKEGNAAVGMR